MIDYSAYAKELRRELHQIPEIGFDLTQTIGVVKRELDKWGIAYTEQYGKSSVVATINPGKPFTIGLRGDMDALPIQEESNNPLPSKIPGQMHACGHDAHTANLIAVGRQLNDMKDSLRCTVKLLFTPAEEYMTPGAGLMVEDGVMDDIDMALACHVNPEIDVGKVSLLTGGLNANSMGVKVDFFGKAAHASEQAKGVDAIRMAVEAYTGLEMMYAREISAKESCILNVGTFHGGNTNNVVCDHVELFLSARAQKDELSDFLLRRIREISEGVASICGGTAKVTVTKLLPYVYNDPRMAELVRATCEKTLGKDCFVEGKRGMGGEDFGFMSRKKPCVMLRAGSRNPQDPNTAHPVHTKKFNIDESFFDYTVPLFVNFVLDYQDGVAF